jgi:hypothetical protein
MSTPAQDFDDASSAIGEVTTSPRASGTGGVLREDLRDGDLEGLGIEVAMETAMAAASGGVCLRKILTDETGEGNSVEGGGVILAETLEEGLGMEVAGGDAARRRSDLIGEGGFAGVDGRDGGDILVFGKEFAITVSVRAGHGVDREAVQEEGGVGGNSHVGREKLTVGLALISSDFAKQEVDDGGGVSAGVWGRRNPAFASTLRARRGLEIDPVEEGGDGRGAGPEAARGARGGVVGSACAKVGFKGGL